MRVISGLATAPAIKLVIPDTPEVLPAASVPRTTKALVPLANLPSVTSWSASIEIDQLPPEFVVAVPITVDKSDLI